MNQLVFLILLHISAVFSVEPPPSPRDGRNAAEEAFKEKLRVIKQAREKRSLELIQSHQCDCNKSSTSTICTHMSKS